MSVSRASLEALGRNQLLRWARKVRGYRIKNAVGMTTADVLEIVLRLESEREQAKETAA